MTRDSYRGDSFSPLSQNLYTYVENNPVNIVDPSGHARAGLTPGTGTTAWFDDLQYDGRWTEANIRQLQKDLNAWGFRDNQGNRLSTDGNYGDRTRFAHRMYFRQQQEFLSQGHTRAEWEQHLKDRAAGNDKVPIKAPASGTSGSGNSYNASKVKCIASDEAYIKEIAWDLFWKDERVHDTLIKYGIDSGEDYATGRIIKLLIDKKLSKNELIKKLVPYYNTISTGKDIIDMYDIVTDLKPIYSEKYQEAEELFRAMKR